MDYKNLVLLFTLITLSYNSMAYTYTWDGGQFSISMDCSGCCVEGREAMMTLSVTNKQEDILVVDGVRIMINGSVLAEDYKTVGAMVTEEKGYFAFKMTVPKPSENNRLEYKVCFRSSWLIRNGSQNESSKKVWICNQEPIKETVYPSNSQRPGCCSSEECRPYEACVNGTCGSIECACGTIIDHRCSGYACCNDSHCEDGYRCINHKCELNTSVQLIIPANTSSDNTAPVYNGTTEPLKPRSKQESLTRILIATVGVGALLAVLMLYYINRMKKGSSNLLNIRLQKVIDDKAKK